MNIPLDIHTHRQGSGIQNCYPEDFIPNAEGWYSVGIHPWKISKYHGQLPWEQLHTCAVASNVLAIGETGLDKLCGVPMPLQIEVFSKHILLAESVNKPLVIHLVKSIDELLQLRRQLKPRCPWVVHGFRGKPAQVQQLVSHGLYLSYGEFANPQSVALTPLGKMFVETDESSLPIDSVLRQVAVYKGMSPVDLKAQLEENVRQVFGLSLAT